MRNWTNALILAAGRGSRIQAGAEELPKPLHRVRGRTLIERTISTLARAGVERFVVVVGHEAEWVEREVKNDARIRTLGIKLEFASSWSPDKSNGASILPAAPLLTEPFVLSMSDHVYDLELARRAVTAQLDGSDLKLCADFRIDEVFDREDATKVLVDQNMLVMDIDKQLREYNCIDCGVFATTPALFRVLDDIWRDRGDASLSEGVLALGRRGRGHVMNIGSSFWQDVDTRSALERAESVLATTAQSERPVHHSGLS